MPGERRLFEQESVSSCIETADGFECSFTWGDDDSKGIQATLDDLSARASRGEIHPDEAANMADQILRDA